MKNSIIFSILCFFLQIAYRFSIDASQISIKSYAWTPVLTRLQSSKVKQSTPAIISTNMVVCELDMTFIHVQDYYFNSPFTPQFQFWLRRYIKHSRQCLITFQTPQSSLPAKHFGCDNFRHFTYHKFNFQPHLISFQTNFG